MAQQTTGVKKHTICIENRAVLTATGVERIEFFSDEVISAQTADGRLNIKGEGLYVENLNAESGELLVKGKVIALSYTQGDRASGVMHRIFK